MNELVIRDIPIRERAEPQVARVGDTIDGRYELLRDLGRGGAGAVFEARHIYTRRIVAIKIIREDSQSATLLDLHARLLREAQALAAARDPGIVDVIDAGIAQTGTPYLVLECLEGRTLEGLLAARERIPVIDTVAIGISLARSLAVAHRAGVVHRDVKPANVFVIRDPDGREHTKLVDFGIAAIPPAGQRKLSKAGALIGTPEYMSPEQLLAVDPVDARSDIYALGVTLYECLTGDVPYSGTYAQILLQSAAPRPTPKVRAGRPEVPPHIAEVIDRALEKARGDRFADMDAFASALAAAARASGVTRLHPALLGPPPLPDSAAARSVDAPLDYTQRRRCPRAAYVTPVRIIVDGMAIDGRSDDISETGMLVLCRGECPEDKAVAVRFASPIDGRVVTVLGRVRWVKGTGKHDHAQRAIGIHFDAVPDDLRASINRYAEMMEDPARRDPSGFSAPPPAVAASSAPALRLL
jgi:serine/threonine-protein kinase